MRSAYTRQRNRVTKEIRYSIQNNYKGLIEKNKGDQKKMWKTINRVLDITIASKGQYEERENTCASINHH